MATTPAPTFLHKLDRIDGTHVTGATASKLLGMPQAELLALSRTTHGPKPESVGVVMRYSVDDLRQWAQRGFPTTLKSGAAGSRRALSIATRANANGVTQPAERERLIATFQRDGITTPEQAARKADRIILARVRAQR